MYTTENVVEKSVRQKKNDLKIDFTDDECWDNDIKISSIDENVNKIYMNNGNHISNVIDFTDDVIEIIDTVKPEKANDSTNDIEIDHKEKMDTVLYGISALAKFNSTFISTYFIKKYCCK